MGKIIIFLLLSGLTAQAGLSKLEAISMIETGNNDRAIGRSGEVSRYQIKPHIWKNFSRSRTYANPTVSRTVAEQYLNHLESLFRERTGREPNDFDRYVMWNAGPTYYQKIGFSARRVKPIIRERALRFVNLRQMNINQLQEARKT